ncbi:MAG: hypothetical protein CMJ78_06915 [Planctomycetaceae bacterium]|nr:hypothetical protein [Planctomycetaceae bacterium]
MTGVSTETRAGQTANGITLLCAACLIWTVTGCQTMPTFRGQNPSPLTEPTELQSPPERLETAGASLESPVTAIQVEGNKTIPEDAILEYVKIQLGRPATEAQIKDDLKRLYSTRWFYSVEPRYRKTKDGLLLVFRVVEKPIIEKVEYRGNKHIKTSYLRGLTGLKKGGAFDVASNRESARRIEQHYKEKGFTDAKVTLIEGNNREDRNVIFEIKEGKKLIVRWLNFEGNEAFSTGILRTKLRTKRAFLGIPFFGGKYRPETLPEDIEMLRKYYQGLGYFDVEIEKKVSYSESKFNPFVRHITNVTVTYKIKEGERYKVRNIKLEGNRELSSEELQAEFKMKDGEYFNSRFLNKDVDMMKDRYGRLGRLFAQIDAVPQFLDEPGTVDVVYRIDEDRIWKIRKINVNIRGDHPHTRESVVLNRIVVSPGDLANAKLIKRSERRLENVIFERGPQLGPRVNVSRVAEDQISGRRTVRGQADDGIGFIDVSVRKIEPNLSASVSYQSVDSDETSKAPAGNLPMFVPITQDDTNKEDFETPLSSKVFSSPSIDFEAKTSSFIEPLTTIRAQSPDGLPQPPNYIFENNTQGDPYGRAPASPFQDAMNAPPGEVDLTFTVNEARTGRLMFGVGVNSDAGVVGSIILEENNFDILRPPTNWASLAEGTAWRGGGQRFRLEAVPGNIVSRYLIEWSDPYFLNTDYSLGVSGFFYNRFLPDWDEERLGGRIRFGRQFTPEWSLSGAIRLENVELTDPDVPTPQILAESVGDNYLSTALISIAHDTRDAPYLPAEGHYIEAGYQQAFGDFDYPRFDVEGRQYFTVYERADGGGRHILSLRASMGWTDNGTPIFERYTAGGFQSFRGFEFRGVSPREFGVRVGGRFLFLGGAEYKIPITADENIAAVAFTDFGTVETSPGFDDFRVTAGVGLRLTVPAMGPAPIALDWAFPVQTEDFDDERVFSFYVGLTR